MARMETPRFAMRLPAHVLNGLAVSVGISIIQITLALTAGPLAALAACTGAICASLADLPIAPARTWRRVGMAALVAWASGLVVRAPSLALTLVAPARVSTITPFLPPAAEEAPSTKLSVVAAPKGTALPALSTTLGAVPSGLDSAPEKVRLLEPE